MCRLGQKGQGMKLKEIKPGMVIHCKTENEANMLLWELVHLGYRWWNGKSICELHFEDSVNGCGYWIKNGKALILLQSHSNIPPCSIK